MAQMQGKGSNNTAVVPNSSATPAEVDQYGSSSQGYGQDQYNPSAWYSGLTTYGEVGNFEGFSSTITGQPDDTDYMNSVSMPKGGLALTDKGGNVGVDANGTVYLKVTNSNGTTAWAPYQQGNSYTGYGFLGDQANKNGNLLGATLSGDAGDLTTIKTPTGSNTETTGGNAGVKTYDADAAAEALSASGAFKNIAAGNAKAKNAPGASPTGNLTGPSALSTPNDPSGKSGSQGGATPTQLASGTIPGSPDIQDPAAAAADAFGGNSWYSQTGMGAPTTTTTTPTPTPAPAPALAAPPPESAADAAAYQAYQAQQNQATSSGLQTAADGQTTIDGSNPTPQITNPVNHDFIQQLQSQIQSGDNAALQNSQSQATQNANLMRLSAGANTLNGNYATQGAAGQSQEALEGQQASQQANLGQQQQQTADEQTLGTALQNESSTELSTDAASMNQQVSNIQDIIGTLQNEITGKTDLQSQQIQQYISDLTTQINSYQSASAQSNFNTSTGLTLLQGITSTVSSLAPLIALLAA